MEDASPGDSEPTDIQRFLQNAILLEMMQDSSKVNVSTLKQKERLAQADHPYRQQQQRASHASAYSPYASTTAKATPTHARAKTGLDQPLR